MKLKKILLFILLANCIIISCNKKSPSLTVSTELSPADILGNPDYLAISYGGYRLESRDQQPTIDDLKEDLKIIAAMGVKILRTYNVQLPHAKNILEAIEELKKEDPNFEMYVMLGAWIDCKDAWSVGEENHEEESDQNEGEIARAVALVQQYPTIVKVLAVGNEAMVHWAASYFVRPRVILKWVKHLQQLKEAGDLPKDLWITSSDNYASWGGGSSDYHVPELEALIKAVDYISLHTYPMHETHYFSEFWIQREEEKELSDINKIDAAMGRALEVAQTQYYGVNDYIKSLGVDKPIHIGETGWSTLSDEFYGPTGSRACDEYKQARYLDLIREWTNKERIACFFFEAFDEQWKDAKHPSGSENHFGLINLNSEAKYAIWELVDKGAFEGLTRGGKSISKTNSGSEDAVRNASLVPPTEYFRKD